MAVLNPLDYYFWARIEAKACERPHNSVTALKEDIKKAVKSLERAEITRAVSKFRKRVEAVIMAGPQGGYQEGREVIRITRAVSSHPRGFEVSQACGGCHHGRRRSY